MKIGTRGSDLALWQARLVRALLQEKVSLETDLVIIKTQGDLDQTATFDKMEGKGFFTKEIEAALLNKSVDLAVHSLKDVPTILPDSADVEHHPFDAEIDHFVDCIREDRESHCNIADAYNTHEVCLAIDRSIELGGQPVKLPLD